MIQAPNKTKSRLISIKKKLHLVEDEVNYSAYEHVLPILEANVESQKNLNPTSMFNVKFNV